MKKSFSLLFVLILTAGFLSAEVYIKQKIHTDEMNIMGQTQPASDTIMEMWMGKNKMAMHQEGQSFIVNLDKKVFYMINNEQKTYIEMELPVDYSKYLPEEMAQMAQMMGSVSVSVQPTSETQVINGFNCKGYDVAMDMMMFKVKTRVWASKEVPFDWKTFMDQGYLEMFKVTMRLNDQSIKEFLEIDGFWIKSETSMDVMGTSVGSTQEVVEISDKAAPAGTFSVPEGYTKQDKFSREDIIRR